MVLNNLEQLHIFLNEGYLLHGSPLKLDRLVPMQAHDNSRVAGCQKAVYASRHHLVAIVNGLLVRGQGPSNFSLDGNKSHLHVIGNNVSWGKHGYVYILDPHLFERLLEADGSLSWEFICREEVEPLQVLEFSDEILAALPIVFLFNP